MDPNFLEYLYVTGELDKDTSLSNPDVNALYTTYNATFPNNPLDNDFFSLTIEEQIELLVEALENNSPIVKRRK